MPQKKMLPGPSPAGWHSITQARLCGHKHYLSDILGLKPQTYSRELLFGQAFHEGKSTFYTAKRGRIPAMVEAAEKSLKDLEPLYALGDQYEYDMDRIGPMLEGWAQRYGVEDLDTWRVLDSETIHEIPVGNHGFFMTVRMDVVLQKKGKGPQPIRVMDTKTTMYSVESHISSAKISGQCRSYLLAVKHLWPEAPHYDFVIDAVYCPRKAWSTDKLVFLRGEPVTLTDRELQVFAEEVEQTLREDTSRVGALFSGDAPDHVLFPRVRDPSVCQAYNRRCEYFDVCEATLTPGEPVFGFEWNPETLQRYENLKSSRRKKK